MKKYKILALPVIVVLIWLVYLTLNTNNIVWFNDMSQEEYELLSDKEKIYTIMLQFNSTHCVFNYTVPELTNLTHSITIENESIDSVINTFTNWILDNIGYIYHEDCVDYRYGNAPLKVLDKGEASCLGRSILIANMLLNYNESLQVYLCSGFTYYNEGHIITLCRSNETWYAIDTVPDDYIDMIISDTNITSVLVPFNDICTFYYAINQTDVFDMEELQAT